jgi:hypothetical protein
MSATNWTSSCQRASSTMAVTARAALALLEFEDAVLDGVLGDEAVDEHGAVLADAVGAVGGLIFDGGVPPGVEQEDVVGGGEVEAGAAGLEERSMTGGPSSAWKRATTPARSTGGAVEADEGGDLGGGEGGLDAIEEGGPLREHEGALWPLGVTSRIARRTGRACSRRSRVWPGTRARCRRPGAGGAGFEGLEGVGAGGEQGDEVGAGGQAQAVVDGALLGGRAGSGGRARCAAAARGDLALAAAEQERANARA